MGAGERRLYNTMKNYILQNKILLAAMAIVFIACLVVTGTRWSIEGQNKTYDIVICFIEIEAMAMQTEHDEAWWLQQFKNMGITKVGLMEENLISMTEDQNINLTATMMDKLTQTAGWRLRYPEELLNLLDEKGFVPFDVLVEIEDEDTAAFVLGAVRDRFKTDAYDILDMGGGTAYVIMRGTPDITLYSEQYRFMNSLSGGFIQRIDIESSMIKFISLGLWPEKVEMIQSLGMQIVPRTMSYNGWNDTQFAQAVIDGYAKYGIVPEYLIVGGQAVIGFDDGIGFAKDYVTEHGIIMGLIENTTQLQNIMQEGIMEITVQTNFNAVRVFSVWGYIQNRFQIYGYEAAEEIENTLFRAITERNIRLIYYKPVREFKDVHTYVTEVSVYEDLFQNLHERLEGHGFSFGSASVMDEYRVSRLFKILFGIGAVIGAVLLLKSFWPMRERTSVILAALGAVCVPAAFFVMPNTSELIVSLATAIIFGCLATVYFTARGKSYSDSLPQDTGVVKIIKYSILTLIGAVIIAIAGGMLTAAPLSSTGYLLEMDIFRGVKVARFLPIAFFAIAYLAYFGYGERKTTPGKLEFNDLKDLFNLNVKVWMMILAGILGGIGFYYISRTGHDSSIEVTNFEMIFRNTLEKLLVARPRTQEFLIAFPALMMMVYAGVRRFKKWSILFGAAGVIGMTSVINTLMHLRTPLYLGFARTGYSVLFGIVIGIVAILVFEGIYVLYNKYLKKYIEEM